MPPLSAYPVHLGRLRLPALVSPSDTLGDGLEAVGAVLVAAERRPRPLELTLHLYGNADEPDPKLVGDRLRRQITGLLENPRALLEGLWLTFEADPMLASYVLIGGGKVSIDDPSLVLGDFELELEDVFRVGTRQTHRPARRIDVRDLRSPTAWRDIRRERYSGDFAAYADAFHYAGVWLPDGANQPLIEGRWPAAQVAQRSVLSVGDAAQTKRWATIGPAGSLASLANGTVIGFEEDPDATHPSDVVIYDLRSGISPGATTRAGDLDPSLYGWEEAYGPAHPLARPPAIANGVCRIRPDDVEAQLGQWPEPLSVLVVETFDIAAAPGTARYIERGRIAVARKVGGPPEQLEGMARITSYGIIEWTPERGVIRLTLDNGQNGAALVVTELYVTLQRGWSGPLLEGYTYAAGTNVIDTMTLLRYVPIDLGADFALVHPGAGVPAGGDVRLTSEPGFDWPTAGDFAFDTLPYAYLQRLDGAAPAVTFAVAIAGTVIAPRSDNASYTDGVHSAVQIAGPGAYTGVALGFGSPGLTREAEALRNASGTTSQIADAAAIGGQAVKDTQAVANTDTLRLPAAQLAALRDGSYDVWVRARVSAAGVTGKVLVTYLDGVDQINLATPDVTSAAYRWLKAGAELDGPILFPGIRQQITVQAWRSAGGAAGDGPIIDSLLLIPRMTGGFGRNGTDADGPQDRAAELLFDVRSIGTLVAR